MAALVGFNALDWILRTYVPIWLDAIGARAAATSLRASKPIADEAGFLAARAAAVQAITLAWEGAKVQAVEKVADAESYYSGKGMAPRLGFDAIERNLAAARIARDPASTAASIVAWRRASLLVLLSGGTQAMDALGASLDAEAAKVTLG